MNKLTVPVLCLYINIVFGVVTSEVALLPTTPDSSASPPPTPVATPPSTPLSSTPLTSNRQNGTTETVTPENTKLQSSTSQSTPTTSPISAISSPPTTPPSDPGQSNLNIADFKQHALDIGNKLAELLKQEITFLSKLSNTPVPNLDHITVPGGLSTPHFTSSSHAPANQITINTYAGPTSVPGVSNNGFTCMPLQCTPMQNPANNEVKPAGDQVGSGQTKPFTTPIAGWPPLAPQTATPSQSGQNNNRPEDGRPAVSGVNAGSGQAPAYEPAVIQVVLPHSSHQTSTPSQGGGTNQSGNPGTSPQGGGSFQSPVANEPPKYKVYGYIPSLPHFPIIPKPNLNFTYEFTLPNHQSNGSTGQQQTLPTAQPQQQIPPSSQPQQQMLPTAQPQQQIPPSAQPQQQTLSSAQPQPQTLPLSAQPQPQTLPLSAQPQQQTIPTAQPQQQIPPSAQPQQQTLSSAQPQPQTLPLSAQPQQQTLPLSAQPQQQTLPSAQPQQQVFPTTPPNSPFPTSSNSQGTQQNMNAPIFQNQQQPQQNSNPIAGYPVSPYPQQNINPQIPTYQADKPQPMFTGNSYPQNNQIPQNPVFQQQQPTNVPLTSNSPQATNPVYSNTPGFQQQLSSQPLPYAVQPTSPQVQYYTPENQQQNSGTMAPTQQQYQQQQQQPQQQVVGQRLQPFLASNVPAAANRTPS